MALFAREGSFAALRMTVGAALRGRPPFRGNLSVIDGRTQGCAHAGRGLYALGGDRRAHTGVRPYGGTKTWRWAVDEHIGSPQLMNYVNLTMLGDTAQRRERPPCRSASTAGVSPVDGGRETRDGKDRPLLMISGLPFYSSCTMKPPPRTRSPS